ncbi:MAG: hypothetical protein OEY91_09805 [Nitrospirota bacterium]|jgi:hypothetical protein|nr:hypothetical protein [Nitrospirota bacterium]
MATKKEKIELSMYGVAEIVKWCITRNNGRVPGIDTPIFQQLQDQIKDKPATNDYYTLDQFYKTRKVFEFTPEEVATIDRCLYDIPNFDGAQLPQIRYKFWPKEVFLQKA